LADSTEPDEPDGFAPDWDWEGSFPLPLSNEGAIDGNSAGESEQETEGLFGDTFLIVTRGDADTDAQFLSGRDVDDIVSDTGTGDNFEKWASLHERFVDFFGTSDEAEAGGEDLSEICSREFALVFPCRWIDRFEASIDEDVPESAWLVT